MKKIKKAVSLLISNWAFFKFKLHFPTKLDLSPSLPVLKRPIVFIDSFYPLMSTQETNLLADRMENCTLNCAKIEG